MQSLSHAGTGSADHIVQEKTKEGQDDRRDGLALSPNQGGKGKPDHGAADDGDQTDESAQQKKNPPTK